MAAAVAHGGSQDHASPRPLTRSQASSSGPSPGSGPPDPSSSSSSTSTLRSTRFSWQVFAAYGALAAAMAMVVVRFVLVAGSSLTYNEATYVELSGHPWYSSYYPDVLFARHPPVAFLALGAWTTLFGTEEWVVRLPALAAVLAGVSLCFAAARRWPPVTAGHSSSLAAAVAALAAGASFSVHAYGLQATMYPFAFCLGAAAVWARAAGRERLEAGFLVAFALTHLFGFLFLVLWMWEHRRRWRMALASTWPAWLWLFASVVLAGALNSEGDVMRLGGLGQLLRTFDTAEDVAGAGADAHLWAGLLCLLALNPVLLAAPGRSWLRMRDWAIALGVLIVFFFLASPYPRYAVVPLAFAVVPGAAALARLPRPAKGTATRLAPVALALAICAATFPAGLWYLDDGPDPRAAGDVPGRQDWRGAVALLAGGEVPGGIATSGPTATAYYLTDAGWRVVNRTDAPYQIGLGGPSRVDILRIDRTQDIAEWPGAGAWVVPSHWDGVEEQVGPRGGRECGRVPGLVVYAIECPPVA